MDDAFGGAQTIPVKLGDSVRATFVKNGQDLEDPEYLELPVNLPPVGDSDDAIRTALINFITVTGVNSAPGFIVERMSQFWAQTGIRFSLAGEPSTVTPVKNALIVSGNGSDLGFGRTGTLDVKVIKGERTVPIQITFGRDDDSGVVATRLAEAISNNGFSATAYANLLPSNIAGDEQVIIVDRGTQVLFADEISTNGSLTFFDPTDADRDDLFDPNDRYLDYTNSISDFDLHVLALNFGDTDPSTIDIIAFPNIPFAGLPLTLGIAWSDTRMNSAPGLQNVFALRQPHADGDDTWFPYTAAHEVGHILFADPRPGAPYHFPDPTNLMRDNNEYPDTKEIHDTIDGPKRLTELPFQDQPGQQGLARTESGPNTTPAILRKQ